MRCRLAFFRTFVRDVDGRDVDLRDVVERDVDLRDFNEWDVNERDVDGTRITRMRHGFKRIFPSVMSINSTLSL